MKIILSTDFSEQNNMLFPYAVDLLRSGGGKIILFHAYMDQVRMSDGGFSTGMGSDAFYHRELFLELKNQAMEFMSEKEKCLSDLLKENELTNIEVQTYLKGGEPEYELLELTRAEEPDLILMGTKGLGRKAFLEGSMAKKLMSKVNVPLLAIPENYIWSTKNNILYATNFSHYEVSTINQLMKLTDRHKPTIHIVHLVFEAKKQKAKLLMNELKQAFEEEYQQQKLDFHLLPTKNAAKTLKDFADTHQIGMAAFIANKRGWIDYIFKDKVGKDDFFQLNTPLLAFKCPDS